MKFITDNQIFLYAFAIVAGGVTGLLITDISNLLSPLISPLIAMLLYVMFTQIPFLTLRNILSETKFILALLVTNFIFVPLLVWILIIIFPLPAAILLGVCLVLLTPCIDYVIPFTKLGKGDENLVLASTPLLFIIQILLLPVYLTIFIGREITNVVSIGPFVEAFLLLIVLPLAAAVVTQLAAKKTKAGKLLIKTAGKLPEFLMAAVLFTVVAAQIGKVYDDFNLILSVVPVYIFYLIITPFISKFTASSFKLTPAAGRSLAFSAGTRNSLVVLPLALALPGEWAVIASAVIVTQTITELIGELFYIKLIPKLIK
ncbi:Sodium Bile acid symporter family protein [Jeotgalicoccus saudimassiliensis]|uniref:Sodium Bile acid symporter family protein n=1 Tax=Jeotgalicoccus saudimassiliensis TaxID=1461582 RepID=A0A078M408_9STAP|nr:arsenic resistance protein [Jeotgalicoccus saudimassiliensis]CEA00989.1 Sodium Bile acid symporter family protein [Jeotgalicoccus saudimassiliensis]